MLSRSAALLFLSLAAVRAETYRVGPSRKDTSLNAVAARLHAGDVVEVDGGATYRGQITLGNSGAPGKPIVIRGLGRGAGRPVLATSGGVIGGSVVRFWGHHYVLENFEVTGGRDKATARGLYVVADDVTIRNCVVHDVAGQGIHASDTAGSLTLDRVEVYRCGAGDRAHQIYVATDNAKFPAAVFRMEGCYLHDGLGGNNVKSRAGRTEIYGNWIEGAAFHELDLIGADASAQKPGTADVVREDADVVGNLLRKRAGSAGTFAHLGTDGTGASNGRYRFFHNTFVVDADCRGTVTIFGMKAAVQSLEVFNNVFFSPAAKLRVVSGGSVASTGANNWASATATDLLPAWTGTLTGRDPGFRNAATLDFTPRADSPLVGAGVKATVSPPGLEFPHPLPNPTLQPTRPPTPRSSAADIGAFSAR
jgi:hypothetical protein